MKGWFAVKRGITSHHVFKGHPERLAVWMWLLDNAAWKDTRHDIQGKTVAVPRGSVCASERHIAKACGVGYQVVRTALRRFKSEHMINAAVTHGKNIISLCNYDKYQSLETPGNAEGNAPLTQDQRKPNAQKEQGNKITIREEDTKVSLCDPIPANDVSEAVKTYNLTAGDVGWPQVQKMSPDRSRRLRTRLKDCGGLEGWAVALAKARDSDFLCGRTDRPWSGFGFDWMTAPRNFTKLMEGNYDNRPDNPSGNGSGRSAAGTEMAQAFANVARRQEAKRRSSGDGGGTF